MIELEFLLKEFKKTRDKNSRFFEISCSKENCQDIILIYQKKGIGGLKRLFCDQILWPEDLNLYKDKDLDNIPNLTCQDCGQIIGVPMIYQKRKRRAFRLINGTFKKNIRKKQKTIHKE